MRIKIFLLHSSPLTTTIKCWEWRPWDNKTLSQHQQEDPLAKWAWTPIISNTRFCSINLLTNTRKSLSFTHFRIMVPILVSWRSLIEKIIMTKHLGRVSPSFSRLLPNINVRGSKQWIAQCSQRLLFTFPSLHNGEIFSEFSCSDNKTLQLQGLMPPNCTAGPAGSISITKWESWLLSVNLDDRVRAENTIRGEGSVIVIWS